MTQETWLLTGGAGYIGTHIADEFIRNGKGFRVVDLGSLNGTYYQGARIDIADLEDGSEVQVGKFRMTYYASRADLPQVS